MNKMLSCYSNVKLHQLCCIFLFLMGFSDLYADNSCFDIRFYEVKIIRNGKPETVLATLPKDIRDFSLNYFNNKKYSGDVYDTYRVINANDFKNRKVVHDLMRTHQVDLFGTVMILYVNRTKFIDVKGVQKIAGYEELKPFSWSCSHMEQLTYRQFLSIGDSEPAFRLEKVVEVDYDMGLEGMLVFDTADYIIGIRHQMSSYTH